MFLLYAILVVSTFALLWAAGACYFCVRRNLPQSEDGLRRLTEMDRESDPAAV
ncbi:MAG: hypothetical protein AB7O65_06585 [Candidatus Korobacteraceae bacterium]